MVTAFRPRDPTLNDSSVLTTIRPITEPSQLYFQWTEYRIQVLQERLQRMLKDLQQQHYNEKPTDVKAVKKFLQQQEEWLYQTNKEIVET
jgi:hypothetical protein